MRLVVDRDGRVHCWLEVEDHYYDHWLPGHVDARMRMIAGPAPATAGVTCFVCIGAWERHQAMKREHARLNPTHGVVR